ncbi:unnamed protein product [Amoebophrya sp. A25]|nr:unnamed protein product [Amoebophrya sp. A25]|eukprot:GSA25T00004636001.1
MESVRAHLLRVHEIYYPSPKVCLSPVCRKAHESSSASLKRIGSSSNVDLFFKHTDPSRSSEITIPPTAP